MGIPVVTSQFSRENPSNDWMDSTTLQPSAPHVSSLGLGAISHRFFAHVFPSYQP